MTSEMIGKVLLNQFRVDSYVASGGMATVFRVRDLKRNVPLAMKVLKADLADDPSMLKRFQREARALKKLVHPNIVPFYGLFQAEEINFLLELFIDGPSLKEVLQRAPSHTISLQDTLIYLKALCSALGYAHANEVIHCDIKPGNVMIDRGGNIYLADFGIARHSDSTTTTMAGAGTAAYMAPEQIRAEAVTPATDIYGLGIVAFELLTGKRPFRGEETSSNRGSTTAERLRHAHLTAQPPDPRQLRPDLPAELSGVLLKSLAKDPLDRYSNTMAFFTALCQSCGVAPDSVPDRVASTDLSSWYSDHVSTEIIIPEVPVTKSLLTRDIIQRFGVPAVLALIVVVALILILPRLFSGGPLLHPASSPVSLDGTATITAILSSTPLPVTPTPTTTPAPPTSTPEPTPTSTNTQIPYETMNNEVDGAEMVLIPEGEFTMGAYNGESPIAFWGAEGPAHKVYLDAYWMYRTEVTNRMYSSCVEAKACPRPEKNSTDAYPEYYTDEKYADYPVVHVTWTAAQAYCVWAGGRLPTEAQWEKAARGDDQRFFPWGNERPENNRANYCDVNCIVGERDPNVDDGYRETAPVGSFPEGASYYGILDMSGNAYEWVWDWFEALYYEHSAYENPVGPASGATRIVRGGSWYTTDEALQTVVRNYYKPTRALNYLGFRCATEASETN